MVKNWFVLAIGLQYLVAGAVDIVQGRYVMASVWFSYAVAGIALAVV